MKPKAHTPPSALQYTSAFTLIELLTVIAIIGILAAIIIPTIGTVRKTARWAQGTSNIRQVTMGMIMMAQEHAGRLPCWNQRSDGKDAYWNNVLTQYLNNANQDELPQRDHPALLDPLVNVPVPSAGIFHFSAPDLQLPDKSRNFASGSFAKFAPYRNLHGYTTPSQQIYFADAGVDANGRAGGNLTTGAVNLWTLEAQTGDQSDDPIIPGNSTPTEIRWTDGKAKFAFMDGHVKILKQEEVKKRNLNPLL